MRKTTLVLVGAAAGAVMVLLATQPQTTFAVTSAKAALDDTYRQLNLFGDVFERVRADYVDKPDDSKLIESAIGGMLAGLDPHSSYMDPKSFQDMQVETSGEFGGPRHRGHDGRRTDQSSSTHRRHARRQGRHSGERPHHQTRRRPDPGHDPKPGGREDARPGEHRGQTHHQAQGPGQADRDVANP